MNGTIYLIGGGELRNGETQLIDEDVLSLAPNGSKFVFFGFAAHDSADYADTVTSVYGKKYTVVVPTVAKGREFAIEAIQSAAVIYLGGGSTEQLMRVFAEWDLVGYLQAAIDRGTHVAGMSAGAQALSAWYMHDEDDMFEPRKGWGIVPCGVLVHATKTSYDKTGLLWSNHGMPDMYPFVAIEEGAAWRLNGLEETKVGTGAIWKMAAKNASPTQK